METDYMKKIIDAIGKFALKLGQKIETLWPHIVRHTVIMAIGEMVAGLFLLFTSLIIFSVGFWMASQNNWKDGLWCALLIPGTILFIISSILCFNYFPKNLAAIFEPIGHIVKNLIKEED